jgi:ABC-type branched-subunit amino acid transport system ATPase component/ABC-type branched-subunit amino acid transport system permease subunit
MSTVETTPRVTPRLKDVLISAPGFGRRGQVARPALLAIVITAIGMAVLFSLNGNYNDSIFVLGLCYAITVIGMVVQIGQTNQLAFHQAFFMMLGGYSVGVMNTKYNVPVVLAILAVVAASALIGALIGSVATRVPGFGLALATLFFSVIASGYVGYSSYLGQATGINGIGSIWSGSDYISSLERSGAVALVLLGVGIFVCARIMRSGIGLELSLVGESERMAASLGINTRRRKLEVFVLSAMLAALGGGVFAGTQTLVSPGNFDQTAELSLLIMLFLGGRQAIIGGLIGTGLVEYLQAGNTFISSHIDIIEGVLFTLILLYAPEGLLGVLLRVYRNIRRMGRKPNQGAPAPARASGLDGASSPDAVATASPAIVGNGAHPPAQTRPVEAEVASSSGRRIDSPDQVLALECQGVTKRFGGVVAVDEVSLTVAPLGVHALCGPNGAGKSTLFELICGGLQADAGDVFIEGHHVSKTPAYQRAQLGVARTLQSVRLMNSRSALDNVAVAAVPSHRTFITHAVVRSDLAVAYERAWETLEELGISSVAQQRVGELTLEAQRMVELARAMVTRPKILLLDEPASGLSSEQRARLAARLSKLGETVTVFLVEHDLQMVMDIAEEIFVLLDGRIVFTGNSEEFRTSSIVRQELMGLLANDALETI